MLVNPVMTTENENGGIFQSGAHYGITTKEKVRLAYVTLCAQRYPLLPSSRVVAARAQVGRSYAFKVMKEMDAGAVIYDPKTLRQHWKQEAKADGGVGSRMLETEHEIFLLSLRCENGARPNSEYVRELYLSYGIIVSITFISEWFRHRFGHRGTFRKPNVIPLDKYRAGNILRYVEYMHIINAIPDHSSLIFVDEKHFLNKDSIPNRVRADPLSGRVDSIKVAGDFRTRWNLIAAISGCVLKPRPIAYTIAEENGTAAAFLTFIEQLISTRYFRHNEVLVMDNAAIHKGGAADIVEDLLWETIQDGMPLNVCVVFLPTRSPELNPIELIFHILARRARHWTFYGDVAGRSIVRNASKVLDEMSIELITKCFFHCGLYNRAHDK